MSIINFLDLNEKFEIQKYNSITPALSASRKSRGSTSIILMIIFNSKLLERIIMYSETAFLRTKIFENLFFFC